MPPTYFYHLKFELYPDGGTEPRRDVYIPNVGTDIFDSTAFPAHAPLSNSRPTKVSTREGGVQSQGRIHAASPADARRGAHAVVIDCGPGGARASSPEGEHGSHAIVLPSRRAAAEEEEFPPPSPGNIQTSLAVARRDWRFGRVRIESLDLLPRGESVMSSRPGLGHTRGESSSAVLRAGNTIGRGSGDGNGNGLGGGKASGGINAGLSTAGAASGGGSVTKARFEEVKNTEVGWGVVHLYRDEEEIVGLGLGGEVEVYNSASTATESGSERAIPGSSEQDCTIVCIPAVPSYLTPSDFLGFVGEKTRDEVSHIRMVMTGRMNRYLVLMKFRDGTVARKWKAEWDGKVFNSMEPETCHVMFIKSITFQTPSNSHSVTNLQPTNINTSITNTSFPALSYDPFTPNSTSSAYLKPFPPPTPSLIELPTCPVCLERMDDTTAGLLTILCQHVFHCSCLQKWRGSGCPVCRHTNPSPLSLTSTSHSADPPFGSGEASLCSVCDCTDDLWICLICGKTGCGRYKGGHAKQHWKESAHNFAVEIETQHVWDYAEDVWVHRLIRNKGDGKVVELPGRSHNNSLGGGGGGNGREEEDTVPREKFERMGMEYTHLLTSQLESQRVYFEELVSKAVSKASAASSAATLATTRAEAALAKFAELESQSKQRADAALGLERDLERERRKAEKSSEVARGFGKSLTEEKRVSEGLMARIEHINASVEGLRSELAKVREENRELKDENRDLLFSITAQSRLQDMAGEGGLEEGELEGGSLVLPPEKKGRKKGKR